MVTARLGASSTSLGLIERRVQHEDHAIDEVAHVLVVGAAHVADPLVSELVLGLLAQPGGHGAVHDLLRDRH